MTPLSPSTSRFAALSLLLVAILVPIFYLFIPLATYYSEQSDEITLLQRRLATYDYLINHENTIDEELRKIEALGVEGDIFLKGTKTAIASANLRELVNEAVKRSGGQLVSSQEYEASSIPSAMSIGLRVQVSGEVANIVQLLHDLEDARPVIFIDNLTVTSLSSRVQSARRPVRRANDNTPARSSLDVRLDIVGYLPEYVK